MARSLTRLPEFSSRKKIRENQRSFLRRLHAEYKTAQELLISTYLEVEEDIDQGNDPGEVQQKEYWIRVLELCFNTFVWTAERWERNRVKRVFKGPKHGSTKSRNVSSVLTVVRDMNKRWSDFAIALDFSSFECIADVLRVRISPKLKSSKNQYIEVKEQELASLKLFDGLRVFGSVPFEGFIAKPICDRDMLDILFGRLRFFYHLDGDRFLNLCHAVGIDAGYSSEKEFRRRRSSGDRGSLAFRGRLLWMRKKHGETTLFLSEGMLHDMCLNWVHPYWWVRQHLDLPDFTNVRVLPDRYSRYYTTVTRGATTLKKDRATN